MSISLKKFTKIAKVFLAGYLNTTMSIKNNVKLIQEILLNLDNNNEDKHLQTLHDLGYLIGLLARIANNDSFVYSSLKAELERLKNKK